MPTRFAPQLGAFLLFLSLAAAHAGTAGDLSDDPGRIGVIAVLGAALVMILALALLWYFARRRRKK